MDPFEAALEKQQDSPPESPIPADEEPHNSIPDGDDDEDPDAFAHPASASSSQPTPASSAPGARPKEEDDDEDEEENMDVDLGRISSGDPDKTAKMQAILSRFTEEQMTRYESFRRSGFQRSNMKRLLASIAGTQKISVPMTIVVSGIAKMFVGELIETARNVMTERRDTGPIRPCHIREAYRRLKLEGKVPKRSVPRLFH